MNKSLLVGAVLGAVGVTAGGAVATYSLVKSGPEYAQVLAVQPVKTQIKTPREVCKDVAVTRQKPVQDQHQIVGTVVKFCLIEYSRISASLAGVIARRSTA